VHIDTAFRRHWFCYRPIKAVATPYRPGSNPVATLNGTQLKKQLKKLEVESNAFSYDDLDHSVTTKINIPPLIEKH
jgi:hypothetical protein